jgi:hypothetical protein
MIEKFLNVNNRIELKNKRKAPGWADVGLYLILKKD